MRLEFAVKIVTWRPYAALAIGLLAASSSSILIRYAQTEGAPSLLIAAWRVAVAVLILTPFVWARHSAELRALKPSEIGLAMLSGLFLAVHFGTWITSLEYTSVLISATLVTTNPLIVALLTPLLLREKLSRQTIGAIVLAIVGGVIISTAGGAGTAPRQEAPLLGVLLSFLGAVAVAVYYIIGRKLRATLKALPYIWLVYGSAALTLIVVLPLTGQSGVLADLPLGAFFWMTLVAIFPQLIGHSLFNFALGYLSAAFVSLIILGEPILSAVFAVFLLNELPQPLQLVGSAVILVALFIASRAEARAMRPKVAEPEQVLVVD
ncbi:MAG: DMT family transporter [Chloroflexi bacterium CFX4]|nr:DMT family transporter [Chloroflexi bacterium CFX4]MDL1924169.1 DMT family transporter [Chloroflexi bacterium CFX3]